MGQPSLDLDLIRTFLAIIRDGSFTRAAGRMNCTQSTVSLHVRRLEETAGAPLFRRLSRGVALTETGELLRTYASGLMELNDEALLRLRGSPVSGSVRLGLLDDFATPLLPDVLRRFAAVHPGVQVEVRSALSADLLRDLGDGELDLVLARCAPGSRGGEPVWRERLLWVAGPRPCSLDGVLPLVLFPDGCVYRPQILRLLRQRRRDWRVAYTCPSLAGVQAAVQAGIGITVLAESTGLPSFRVLDEAEHGLPSMPDTELALFGEAESDAILALRRFLADAVAAMPRAWTDHPPPTPVPGSYAR